MLNVFEQLSKQTPFLVIASVVISTLHTVGFFAATGNPSLITNLSYQDLITSSVYAIVFILPALVSTVSLQNSAFVKTEYFNTFTKIAYVIIFVLGLLLVYFDSYSYVGWFCIFIVGLPYLPSILVRVGIILPKNTLLAAAALILLSIISFGSGYGNYRTEICAGTQFYSKDGELTQILKIYSEFLVLHKGEGHLMLKPNTHDFEIVFDSNTLLERLNSPECNPIGDWFERITERFNRM